MYEYNQQVINSLGYIRRVYLFLITICIVIIAAISSKPQTEYEKASKQAREIQTVCKLYDYKLSPSFFVAKSWDTFDYGNNIEYLVGGTSEPYIIIETNGEGDEKGKTFYAKLNDYKITNFRGYPQAKDYHIPFGASLFRMSDQKEYEVSKIGDFISFWNDLLNINKYYVAYPTKDAWMVLRKTNKASKVKNVKYTDAGPIRNAIKREYLYEDARVYSIDNIENCEDEKKCQNENFGDLEIIKKVGEHFENSSCLIIIKPKKKKDNAIEEPIFIIAAKTSNIPIRINPLYELINHNQSLAMLPISGNRINPDVPYWKEITGRWEPKIFKEAFPQLNNIVENIPSIEVRDLIPLTEILAKLDNKEMSFMGINFSYSNLYSIAAVFIWLISLYFYVNLKELNSAVDRLSLSLPYYPWVGLYISFWSRLLYFSSVAVLPTAAIVLMIAEFGNIASFNLHLIINIFSLLFEIVIVFKVIQLSWNIQNKKDIGRRGMAVDPKNRRMC